MASTTPVPSRLMSIERAKLPRIPFTWITSTSSSAGCASWAYVANVIPAPSSKETDAAMRVFLKVMCFIITLLLFSF